MWPISDACKAALAGSHTRTPIVEIFDGFGAMIAASYTTPRVALEPTGQISVDWTGKFVRSLSATVVDIDGQLAPAVDAPLVDPLRRPQLQSYFDIGWLDPLMGTQMSERIPSGRFVISRAQGTEVGSGETIAIEGTSRSGALITDNAWLAPYNVPGGVPYSVAIRTALQDRKLAGWLQLFRFETSVTQTPFGIVFGNSGGSDPWVDLQQMAVSDGRELLEDQVGSFVLRTPPTLDDGALPTASYNDVNSPRLRSSATRDVDTANAYNGVILRSSAPWLLVPVISVRWVDDPGSPLYYLGPFGKKPFQVDDATVATQDQADAACLVKFNKVTGVTEQISFNALPNPAHDPGDPIEVVSAATGVSSVALLRSFVLPFDVTAPMPCTVQRRRAA